MVELSYFALFLLLTCSVAAGVVAAVVHTWSLRALAYSLDTRLSVVEGNLLREVKARAGQERWKQPSPTEKQLQEALALRTAQAPEKPKAWWLNPDLKRSYP